MKLEVHYNSIQDHYELNDPFDYLLDVIDDILYIAQSRDEMENYIKDNYPDENIKWITPNFIAEELELMQIE